MRTPKYITFDQVARLAEHTDSREARALIYALAYTGARISEVLSITPRAVSFEERWISIPHLKHARKRKSVKASPLGGTQKGPLQGPPKQPEGQMVIQTPQEPPEQLYRRIPLAAPLIPIFHDLIDNPDRPPGKRLTKARRADQAQRQLFPFSRMSAFRIVRDASIRSGIRTQDGRLVHPHALRHSFAIQWIKGGGKLEMLQLFLGHSDSKTTSIYLQFAPTDLMHEQDRIFKTVAMLIILGGLWLLPGCTTIKNALHDIVPAITVGITKDDHKSITIGVSIDVKDDDTKPAEDLQNDAEDHKPAEPPTTTPGREYLAIPEDLRKQLALPIPHIEETDRE
jgi:integrase